MLKLTYTRKRDRFQTVTLMGDPIGIRDLYWQLTHNYKAQDGTEIGSITVSNLDGVDCTADFMTNPHANSTHLSSIEN